MSSVLKRDSMDAITEELEAKLKEAALDQSTASQNKRLGLADLPPSVRNNIYKHVLDTEFVNLGKPNVSYTHSIRDGVLHFKASRPPFPIDTALFYVSKNISAEAVKYFYSQNLFIKLSIYTADARHAKTMLEDSGLLFSTTTTERLDRVKNHAMDLTVLEKNSSQLRASVMFPAQYLPRLINFLNEASKTTASWSQHHSLFINVLNTYDFPLAKLQGDLLELFRLLTNLGAVTIDNENLLPGYAQDLQESMTAASFTATHWLGALLQLAEQGDENLRGKKFALAKEYYEAVIIALTYGYLTRAEVLHTQAESFPEAIQHLRWRCELHLSKSLSGLESSIAGTGNSLTDADLSSKRRLIAKDMLQAESSASRALSLSTDSPSPSSNPWFATIPAETIPPNKAEWFTDAERGQSWLQCGVAHMALGEYLFAAGDLERASRLLQGNEELGKEVEDRFAEAREKIDWNIRPGVGLEKAARLVRG
ncbi:hypothetical protein CC78DRAFT_569191 [Lojkania enalia]|uniref:Uncharacterized protein n=1 Tax=Lojkania enalia TaxID=147567 RepID=A0A9P4K8S3_9PLEO|nr:hypothetical protein CC78DRAFT_569191 [Didymosphaeria enalia]